MKRRKGLMAAAALLLLPALPLRAGDRVHLGVAGGLARYGFSGDAPEDGEYRSLTSGTFGAVAELELLDGVRISLQPSWIRKGSGIAFEARGQEERVDSVEVRTDYLSLPIMLKVFTKGGRWFVSSGVEIAWLGSARYVTSTRDEEIEGDIDDLDIAVHFGVGRVIPVGRHAIFIEGRYAQSVVNLASTDDPEGWAYGLRLKNSGLLLCAGFLLRL